MLSENYYYLRDIFFIFLFILYIDRFSLSLDIQIHEIGTKSESLCGGKTYKKS